MGRRQMREFFSELGEFVKFAATMPFIMLQDGVRERDGLGITLGVIFSVLYAALAIGIGALTWNGIKNPEYSFKDVEDGRTTVVEVVPSQQQVLHRFNKSSGVFTDFKAQKSCDAAFSYNTTYVPMTTTINNITTTTIIPVTTETKHFSNCNAFNTMADKGYVVKMNGYLQQAQGMFSARLLNAFN